MANYKLIIKTSTGTSSGAYNSTGTDTDFVIDRGASRTSKQRILSAKFGDGYEQRVLDGINTKEETFSVSFKNRSSAEINIISDFLDDIVPASFDFYIDNDTIKVICQDYSTSYDQTTSYSLSAKFKRVYEA